MKTQALDTSTAICESISKTTPQTSTSKYGRWRRFHKHAGLMQYIPSSVYFARAKVDGKSIRASLESDVLTTAKFRLSDKIKELRKPPAEVGTFADGRLKYEAATNIVGDYEHRVLREHAADYFTRCGLLQSAMDKLVFIVVISCFDFYAVQNFLFKLTPKVWPWKRSSAANS